jgi:hypothetical protein
MSAGRIWSPSLPHHDQKKDEEKKELAEQYSNI